MNTYQDSLDLATKLFSDHLNRGISTGLDGLDKLIGGLKNGTLTVLAGSTGMGKSLLGLQILVNVAKSGTQVGYLDLENGSTVSWKRILKIWYSLTDDWFNDPDNIFEGFKLMRDLCGFNPESQQFDLPKKLSYWSHEDVSEGLQRHNLSYLTSLIEENSEQIRVWLIDPLQVLEANSSSKDLLQEQGKIVMTLKNCAQKFGLAIILCHHLRKNAFTEGNMISDVDDLEEVKYKIPSIEDLRGSGKIVDFATDVWGFVRSKDSKHRVKRSKSVLRVLKNRTGLTGDVKLYFDERTLSFGELRPVFADEENQLRGIFDGGVVRI